MRHAFPIRLVLVLALVVVALPAAAVAKQSLPADRRADSVPARGAFVIRLGADTIGVERFIRTRDRLEVRGVGRAPVTTRRHTVVTYGADGDVATLHMRSERADGSAPATTVDGRFGADSVEMVVTANGQTRASTFAGRGAVPQLDVTVSVALLEPPTMRFLASGKDSAAVPMAFVGGSIALPMTFARLGSDSVSIEFQGWGAPFVARVDRVGRIVRLHGLRTTQQVVVERVEEADIDAFASDFARRDAAGTAVGALSPADTSRASVGAASVQVAYSQPALRGRTAVGGQLVPYGRVWRTGANAATTLTTDRALDVGGTTIPAGTYTLWTLPSATRWTLIVNRKTRDGDGRPLWGTRYDAKEDVARIPMTVSRSAGTVERFRITLDGGALRMAWENTVASVPVAAR